MFSVRDARQVRTISFSSYGAWPSDRESRAMLNDPSLLAASAKTLECVAGMSLAPRTCQHLCGPSDQTPYPACGAHPVS